MCYATAAFDVLHPGHVYHLQTAKRMGDVLVVSLTRDAAVNKGPRRPVHTWADRAAVLLELRCVDRVIPVHSSLEALRWVQPDIFVKGNDYRRMIEKEDAEYCSEHGIQIRFTDCPVYSTIGLLNYFNES